jgi:hypothetical protein
MTVQMTKSYPWSVLELPGPSSTREVKKNYAKLAKQVRPDTDPLGFQALREAYELAIRYATDNQDTFIVAKGESLGLGDDTKSQNLENTFNLESYYSSGNDSKVNPTPMTEVEDAESVDAVAQNETIRERNEWQAAIHELTTFISSQSGQSNMNDSIRLSQLIDAIRLHSANSNLQISLSTEEQLIHSAAYSSVWPEDSLKAIWEQYRLDSRIAFSGNPNDAISQISRQIDDFEYWNSIKKMATEHEKSFAAPFFRDVELTDRLPLWFSTARRNSTVAFIDWCKQHSNISEEVSLASIDSLNRTIEQVNKVPQLGIFGWIFLILVAITFLPLLPNFLGYEKKAVLSSAISIAGFFVVAVFAQHIVIPCLEKIRQTKPSLFDVGEYVVASSLLLSFGVGKAYPLGAPAIMFLAGLALVCIGVLYKRFFEFLMYATDNYAGVIALVVFNMFILFLVSPSPTSVAWPIAALATFCRVLPNPPVNFHEWSERYVLRSGLVIDVPAKLIWWWLMVVMISFSTVILFTNRTYEASVLSHFGMSLIVLVWMLIGFPSLARLSQHLGPSGMVGFILMSFILGMILHGQLPDAYKLHGLSLVHLGAFAGLILRLAELIWQQSKTRRTL